MTWASPSPYRLRHLNSTAGRSSSFRQASSRMLFAIRSRTSGCEACRKPSDRSISSSIPPTFYRTPRSDGGRRRSTGASESARRQDGSDFPSERVRLAVVQITNPFFQARGAHFVLEVRERGGEDVVVVLVDRDGKGGIDDPHRLHALLRVHADQDPQHPRAAQVQQ